MRAAKQGASPRHPAGRLRAMLHDTTRLSTAIAGRPDPAPGPDGRFIIGVLAGEGIGPQVVAIALDLLRTLEAATGQRFAIQQGGVIGAAAEQQFGSALTEEVTSFCQQLFAAGGALLHGPGGGRFVYDLRRRFDLFCKICPIRVHPELLGAQPLKPERLADVDALLIRDNAGGVYQGSWELCESAEGERIARHEFSYSEAQVQRIVAVAAQLAAQRRGRLTVVVKDGGLPSITALWRDVAGAEAQRQGIAAQFVNIDFATYRLVNDPRSFDVVVLSNLFGDILVDLSSVLSGSRGMSYSGNFSSDGAAAYQTNHGAAHDLTDTQLANPVGQILALAMLLRESFALADAAGQIEAAVREVWRAGWRTADLAEPNARLATTRQMGELVQQALEDRLQRIARG